MHLFYKNPRVSFERRVDATSAQQQIYELYLSYIGQKLEY